MQERWAGQGKSAANMTLEEFKQELQRIRQKALYIDSVVGKRQDRSYMNQKRGKAIGLGH